ncbi:MAG TPA: metallophosphoesterase family protein [Bryobacteraceae bacterium]|nr:metallophosphoesterase family protein [Bryobacteraceae bacterium]
MRYLILSDIHANLEALEAVLKDAKGLYDDMINCGDVVGYGPDPNAVIEWCRKNSTKIIRGNHDKACAGIMDLRWFNDVARHAAQWTREELTPDNFEWLNALPQGPLTVGEFQAFHGSPADEDEYMADPWDIEQALPFSQRNLIFFGHTHLQGAFHIHRNGTRALKRETIDLEPDSVYFINPGSVGQPRDGNPKAAYAIFDDVERLVTMKRVPYDVNKTMQKIVAAGLPEVLGLRLQIGR